MLTTCMMMERENVQSCKQPRGEVFMLPKPVASKHLAESGTFRNAWNLDGALEDKCSGRVKNKNAAVAST